MSTFLYGVPLLPGALGGRTAQGGSCFVGRGRIQRCALGRVCLGFDGTGGRGLRFLSPSSIGNHRRDGYARLTEHSLTADGQPPPRGLSAAHPEKFGASDEKGVGPGCTGSPSAREPLQHSFPRATAATITARPWPRIFTGIPIVIGWQTDIRVPPATFAARPRPGCERVYRDFLREGGNTGNDIATAHAALGAPAFGAQDPTGICSTEIETRKNHRPRM